MPDTAILLPGIVSTSVRPTKQSGKANDENDEEENNNGKQRYKNIQDMNPEELEKAAGGDFPDDVSCFFGSHEWTASPVTMKDCGKVPHIYFLCYKCKNCGKFKYIKENTKTGENKTITKEEYDKAQF